jgi:ectoine hydroxylase-related dioxygenase (phytanoyl-CoA dioxygenase family)
LFDAAQALLEEAGVIAAASEYLGRRARVIDVNPQINDRTDSFWRDIFPDQLDGKKLPKTAYFHRDASGGDLKAIIYMVPVTERNGPFGYVVGSHRLDMSALDNFICEANDHNGLSDTAPDARRRFASLPKRFRQKGAFGNDLPDDCAASRELLRAAWAVTGPKGSIVLFDTKGTHRGGMVEAGERHVITCVIG